METEVRLRTALNLTLWSLVSVMGAVWAMLGNSVGWLGCVAGVGSVFFTGLYPPKATIPGSRFLLAVQAVSIVLVVFIILDMAGIFP